MTEIIPAELGASELTIKNSRPCHRRFVRFSGGIEHADIFLTDAGLKTAGGKLLYAFQSCLVDAVAVRVVLSAGCLSKVVEGVVQPPCVGVVDIVRWPFAGHVEPREAVSFVSSIIDRDHAVAVVVSPPRDLSRITGVPPFHVPVSFGTLFPPKQTKRRAIIEDFLQSFLRQIHRLNITGVTLGFSIQMRTP